MGHFLIFHLSWNCSTKWDITWFSVYYKKEVPNVPVIFVLFPNDIPFFSDIVDFVNFMGDHRTRLILPFWFSLLSLSSQSTGTCLSRRPSIWFRETYRSTWRLCAPRKHHQGAHHHAQSQRQSSCHQTLRRSTSWTYWPIIGNWRWPSSIRWSGTSTRGGVDFLASPRHPRLNPVGCPFSPRRFA